MIYTTIRNIESEQGFERWASVKTKEFGHRRVRAIRQNDIVFFTVQGARLEENTKILKSLTAFQLRKIIANTMEEQYETQTRAPGIEEDPENN